MLFSSISFIYYFLPILLIIYFAVPKKAKNLVLLIASLLFYFYGEPKYVLLLISSCIINYIFAILIEKNNDTKKSKLYLILGLIVNIGALLYFKYMDFFIQNINSIFNTNFSLLHVIMPIGISFFTFQTISYIIDVYKKKAKAQTNILDFATYICLFPQLVAGPIVRYVTIQDELHLRTHSFKLFSQGVSRFVIGLAKKVLIANTIGQLCTTITNLEQSSVLSYWIQAIAYTLQIYFDFSGYSDMAIGLGLMFGFKFLENFNYPLIAKSITDFWRRWHISLSSFLRDYVYIPLGGNRVSKLRWIINIFIVWFLTGFWHGASFNFIIWGLYFAILLLIEKKFLTKILEKHKIFSHIYSIFFIVISFTIFSCTNLNTVFHTIKSMFGFSNLALFDSQTIYYLKSYAILLIIAIISATPLAKNILSKIKYSNILAFAEPIYYVILLIIVTSFLIDSSFNPFLYFRF